MDAAPTCGPTAAFSRRQHPGQPIRVLMLKVCYSASSRLPACHVHSNAAISRYRTCIRSRWSRRQGAAAPGRGKDVLWTFSNDSLAASDAEEQGTLPQCSRCQELPLPGLVPDAPFRTPAGAPPAVSSSRPGPSPAALTHLPDQWRPQCTSP